MSSNPNSYGARDAKVSLHPYTNARQLEKDGPLVIERGKGVYVYDDQGKEYIEALAGLWSVGVGFSEERLVKQAEYSRQALEKNLASARELTELTAKAASDAMSVISQRFCDGLDEVRRAR